MRKQKAAEHRSLVVEAPDGRYEAYWTPETMELAEAQSDEVGSSHENGNLRRDNRHDHHRSHHNRDNSQALSTSFESAASASGPVSVGPIFSPHYPFVVLDCANIGWAFGGSCFSSLGIKIAFDTFQDLPVNAYGFIPAPYVRRKPTDGSRGNSLMETEEWEIMDQLVRSRKISVVPPGDSDDLYILNFAQHHNGFVISNDFFKDHLDAMDSTTERELAKEWLHHRRCSFTFTPDYDGNFSLMLNPSSELVHVLSCSASSEAESSMTLET